MKLLFFLLFPLYKKQKSGFFITLFLSVLTLVAGIGLLCISGWFLISAALTISGRTFNIFVPSSLVRGLSIIRIVSRYAERVTGHDFILRLLSSLRCMVFKSLIRLSPKQLANYRNGDLVTRMCNDISILDTVFLSIILPICSAILTSMMYIIALVPLTSLNISFVIILVFLIYYSVILFLLIQIPYISDCNIEKRIANLRISILEIIEGYTDLVLTKGLYKLRKDFNVKCKELATEKKKQGMVIARVQCILTLLSGIGIVCILWVGIEDLYRDIVDAPSLVGLFLAILGLFEISGNISKGIACVGNAKQGGIRVQNILNTLPDISDPMFPLSVPEEGAIIFDNVNFSYTQDSLDPNNRKLLESINLDIEFGERIAITGPSGSGKTTLLNLLLKLEDPISGNINFGEYNIKNFSQEEFYKKFAFLHQNAPIFLGTLRNNLLIGNPEADDRLLWNALETVKLADFIRSLPKNLDSWFNEMGSNFSMGQIRRFCLARAILSKASILLLDEPTSSLDRTSEIGFFNDLPNIAGKRTVILITHSTNIPKGTVDRIYQLENRNLQLL
ncbi:MAG: thiol reductant ABC exporter subunit CydC [Bordetella sp.]|nr:MAG: thiol reductant ABC exporter subunit CydC [Bordetella sp.]